MISEIHIMSQKEVLEEFGKTHLLDDVGKYTNKTVEEYLEDVIYVFQVPEKALIDKGRAVFVIGRIGTYTAKLQRLTERNIHVKSEGGDKKSGMWWFTVRERK